ncbi:septum formation inhibitor Maf [Pseudoflavonifractor sp. 524-17]|uniref:Maf family protein n=1 Tax=Pseudoflavonifractor sp. 524-17 TaxID=2304577 RepID=UPI00137A6361|nr:Maf family protein [Pseudoflavonifractor sp. 524-17]NCE63639.1 septum formation inhibitor Maf [Pseudoflavonifractor sp. 524-17]
MELILASQSPRRRELLERMGIRPFRVCSPGVDEDLGEELPPAELVCRLSTRKAEAVQAKAGPDALIIAADTVVALDGAILGKPRDEREAFKMLSALSGCRHQVYTGVTVLWGSRRRTEHEVTDVTFRALEEGEIEDYISTKEPMDKAGAYGIQGLGALFVEGIQGDYYNVMGLPVCRLGRMLDGLGLHCMRRAAGRG